MKLTQHPRAQKILTRLLYQLVYYLLLASKYTFTNYKTSLMSVCWHATSRADAMLQDSSLNICLEINTAIISRMGIFSFNCRQRGGQDLEIARCRVICLALL